MLFMTTALLAALAASPAPDTTLAVAKGTRLTVNNHSGRITVAAWNRDEVQVRSTSDDGDGRLRIEASNREVRVAQNMRHGPEDIDLTINVPAWMAVNLQGVETEIAVSGTAASIQAQSVEGSVTISGGAENVSVNAVEGDVRVSGVRGALSIQAVDGGVSVRDLTGALAVQGVDGDVLLDGITSSSVKVSTVDGHIEYRGALAANGSYAFKTHDGNITVRPVGALNATVSVSTWNGEFESAVPVTITGSQEGRRFSFTVGNGSARLELDAFDGLIRLDK
jgi:DUF4097 and DUF4098 domain-containing protein YvlB